MFSIITRRRVRSRAHRVEHDVVCGVGVIGGFKRDVGISVIANSRIASGCCGGGRRRSGSDDGGLGRRCGSRERPRLGCVGHGTGKRRVALLHRWMPQHLRHMTSWLRSPNLRPPNLTRRNRARGHAAKNLLRISVIVRDVTNRGASQLVVRRGTVAMPVAGRCERYGIASASGGGGGRKRGVSSVFVSISADDGGSPRLAR